MSSGKQPSQSTGVKCRCSFRDAECGVECGVQWYARGVCLGCGSGENVKYTWIAGEDKKSNPKSKKEKPRSAPDEQCQLKAGASEQLIKIWTDLMLVRGLTPFRPETTSVDQQTSPLWYRQRGVCFDVNVQDPPADLNEKVNRAADWTNRAFIIQLIVTFEEFAGGNGLKGGRLPNHPGMREFHHARRLRNCFAHGDKPKPRDIEEERKLFRPNQHQTQSSLEIDVVLEPLWARLLLYAKFLEGTANLPDNPGVIVAVDGEQLITQSFKGISEMTLCAGDPLLEKKIGEVV